MANYTTRVITILYSLAGKQESDPGDIRDIIANHWGDIFDDTWTTYDEDYKATLCQKILRHYLTREIGSETFGLWKFRMNTKLAEIMPKYNALYKNIDAAYSDFFKDVDYSETTEKKTQETGEGSTESNGETSGTSTSSATASGTSKSGNEAEGTTSTTGSGTTKQSTSGTTSTKGESSNDSDGWQASNDTPQGGITGLENNTYLSGATHNYGKTGATSSSSSDNTGESSGETTTTNNGTSATSSTSTGETTSESKQDETSKSTSTTTESAKTSRDLTENYVKRVAGKMASENNARLFEEIAESYINIDLDIIRELSDQFIMLWQ